MDWGDIEGLAALTLTFVEQVEDQPYTCFTNIDILADENATATYKKTFREHGEAVANRNIMKVICDFVDSREDIRPLLSDEKAYQRTFKIPVNSGELSLRLIARRLGEDTGRNILINTSNLLRDAYRHMNDVMRGEN